MNEKVKKFFACLGVFFSGIATTLLCVWGAIIHNNRKRTTTVGTEQQEYEESIGTVENGLSSNEQIFERIRERKKHDD